MTQCDQCKKEFKIMSALPSDAPMFLIDDLLFAPLRFCDWECLAEYSKEQVAINLDQE